MTIDLIVVSCEEIAWSYYIIDWSDNCVGVTIDVIGTSDSGILWTGDSIKVSSDCVIVTVDDVVIDYRWFAVDVTSLSTAGSGGAGRWAGGTWGGCGGGGSCEYSGGLWSSEEEGSEEDGLKFDHYFYGR